MDEHDEMVDEADEELPDGMVVSKDAAKAEFLRMLDAMDLTDGDEDEDLDEDEARRFRNHRKRIVRAIQRGSITINDKGEPTFKPRKGNTDPMTFREPRGGSLSSKDPNKKKKTDRTNALLSDMTKQPVARFTHMYGRDYKVCVSLVSLFLD